MYVDKQNLKWLLEDIKRVIEALQKMPDEYAKELAEKLEDSLWEFERELKT